MNTTAYEIGEVVQVDHIHLDTAETLARTDMEGHAFTATFRIEGKQRPMLVIGVCGKWWNLLYMTSATKPDERRYHKLREKSFVRLGWPHWYPAQFLKGPDRRYKRIGTDELDGILKKIQAALGFLPPPKGEE